MEGIKTVNDLRVILAEEITKIRNGETTAANVNAIVNATGKILTTVKMEIEYNKLIGKTPNIDFINTQPKITDGKEDSTPTPKGKKD